MLPAAAPMRVGGAARTRRPAARDSRVMRSRRRLRTTGRCSPCGAAPAGVPLTDGADPDRTTSMRWPFTRASGRPRLSAELRERESVKPLELFFDLVFVLGFTQCTALMAARPTWEGIGQGMLVLALLWWAWVGYAWLTSVIEPEEGPVRIAMLAAMAGLLIVALCVPQAFGDRALGFAI